MDTISDWQIGTILLVGDLAVSGRPVNRIMMIVIDFLDKFVIKR
jgi:hypothetical protein